MKRLVILLGALALVLTACAADGADTTADSPATADTTPAADSGGGDAAVSGPAPVSGADVPPAAGACLVGAEDCDDIPGEQAPPLPAEDEPGARVDPDAVPIVVTDMSVSEALETDAAGLIAVRGFLVADAGGSRLCELLAESLPPQCGGASIEMTSLDGVDPDSIEEAQGVQWTDDLVIVFGQIVDGKLVPEV
jgi:hypothetical protein